MENLEQVYKRRFGHEIKYRKKLWKTICEMFFQKYIPKRSTVLDLAAGYCEFINNIQAKRKIALDLNPDVKKFANKDVEVLLSDSKNIKLKDNSVDIVFTSSFFEHLTKPDIVATIKEVHRILRPKGRFLILQPNIKYCYKKYWMFFDHITPIDDRALVEILEITHFRMINVISKFLP